MTDKGIIDTLVRGTLKGWNYKRLVTSSDFKMADHVMSWRQHTMISKKVRFGTDSGYMEACTKNIKNETNSHTLLNVER